MFYFIVIPEIEEELKRTCAQTVQDILKLQVAKIEALNEFQKAMDDKAFARTKLSIFQQENEELVNVITSSKEKRDNAKVFATITIKEHVWMVLF